MAELAEALPKVRYRLVVSGLIGRVLVALVRHEDEVNDLIHHGIFCQGLQGGDGIGGAVEGGNTDGDALFGRGDLGAIGKRLRRWGLRGAPGSIRQGGFLFRGDIEPQPAAVLEVFERQLKLVVARANEVVGHGNALAILLGPIQRNVGLTLDLQA